MAGESSGLPLDEYQDLVRATSLITELVVLDDAWTREAESSSDAATRDDGRVEQLGGVVDRLDQLYGEIGELAPRLNEIFSANAELLRQRYEALVADDAGDGPTAAKTRSLTADERAKVRAFVEERGEGDLVAFATNGTYQVGERAAAERENLSREYGSIRRGNDSAGDMDPDFEFWLQAVALAATLALGPEAGAIVEVIGGIIDWLVG